MSPYQQTVGIDTVGRTGDERTIVLALGDEQVAHIGGQDSFDLIDLINHRPIKDGDSKSVSDFQLVEISKQLCAGKTAVR